MAKIWPVYHGREPTRGDAWLETSVSEAVDYCDLESRDFVSGLSVTPRFGNQSRDLWYAGFKHVVVEIEAGESPSSNWKPGFYRSRLTPKEVFRRLIRQPLVSALGAGNVVRIDFTPSLDAEGEGAILVTVVITPDAVERLSSYAQIDALDRLRGRLREMRVPGTPIVQYATEAELAEDVGS